MSRPHHTLHLGLSPPQRNRQGKRASEPGMHGVGWGAVSQAGGQLCQAGPGVQESAQTRLGRGQGAESSRDSRVDEILQPGAHRYWAAPSPNPHMDPTAPKNPSPAPQAGRAAHGCTQLGQSPGQGLRAARCPPGARATLGFGGATGVPGHGQGQPGKASTNLTCELGASQSEAQGPEQGQLPPADTHGVWGEKSPGQPLRRALRLQEPFVVPELAPAPRASRGRVGQGLWFPSPR